MNVKFYTECEQLRQFQFNGTDYVVAPNNNQNYHIEIKNPYTRKAVVVTSVDGLSVMTGRPASINDSGYIVDGSRSITIHGWRTSDEKIAQFVFSDKSSSYAVRSGQSAENVGVIGIYIVPEKYNYVYPNRLKKWPINPTIYWDAVNMSSNILRGCAKELSESIGTAFGKEVFDKVNTVTFDRDTNEHTHLTFHYDTAEGLIAKGIPRFLVYGEPKPWPGDNNNYCKPPVSSYNV